MTAQSFQKLALSLPEADKKKHGLPPAPINLARMLTRRRRSWQGASHVYRGRKARALGRPLMTG